MNRSLFIILLTFLSLPCMAQEEPDFNRNLQLYENGLYDEAFAAFSKSAQNFQNVKSQYYLAECYLKGQGVAQDDKKAFQLYRRLAEKGLPVAQAKLAYCLYKGIGTPKDVSRGNQWMEKALFYDKVDAYTLFVEGLCYEEGLGKAKNVKKAMDLYTEALSRGVDEAYVHLATLLYSGGVVVKDENESLRIINEAVANIGSVDDYTCKGNLLMRMGKDQENLENWKTIQRKFPYFAVNSHDDYCLKLRGISPIPETVIAEAVKQQEKKNGVEVAAAASGSSSPLQENKVINNIVIKYEVAGSSPASPQPVNPAPQPENKPVVAQAVPAKSVSDVDQEIPALPPTNENAFALIIANENYQDVAKVPNALNDGEVFAAYCQKTLGMPANNVTLVKDATFNNIKREINKLTQIASAYKGSAKILFYYAGHGIPDEATKNAFLLPVDGYGNDPSTGYSLSDLYETLGKLPAQQVVVLLDACFSGSQRGDGMLASARGVAIKAKPAQTQGNVVVLSAAQGDETAYPYKEQGHGLFTYYLLKKLKESKGSVSLGDLANYVTDNVSKKSIVVNGKSQTPSVNPSGSLGENWKSWKLK